MVHIHNEAARINPVIEPDTKDIPKSAIENDGASKLPDIIKPMVKSNAGMDTIMSRPIIHRMTRIVLSAVPSFFPRDIFNPVKN